ncbi:MAG TPA: hypothetical protein VJ803_11595 [Gemmatimonadaceae bacterium]|nr:hypothetical protein [Gemmatimonadaceae bacterium]
MTRRIALLLTLATLALSAACSNPTGPSSSKSPRPNAGVFSGSGT